MRARSVLAEDRPTFQPDGRPIRKGAKVALPGQGDVASLLRQLAGRVRRLGPSHRYPEAFHLEKSEIEHELRSLALSLSAGGRS